MFAITFLAEGEEIFALVMIASVSCGVGTSQMLSKTYSAWFTAKKEGEIENGHCTYIAG